MKVSSILKLTSVFAVVIIFATSCTKTPAPRPTAAEFNNVFIDNFISDTHNWSFSHPADSAFVSVHDGYLDYYYNPIHPGTNTVAINTGCNISGSFSIMTSFSTNNIMGLAFGVSSSNYGYAFLIDNTGKFALYNEGNSTASPQAIINWQSNSNIKINDYNTIQIDQFAGTWKGYINGIQIFIIPSNYFTGSQIGYIINSGTEGFVTNLTVRWNN